MRNGPGMMGIMDRPPLSREEFLEVQERQRQERHRQQRMLEHSERSVDMALITLSWNYWIGSIVQPLALSIRWSLISLITEYPLVTLEGFGSCRLIFLTFKLLQGKHVLTYLECCIYSLCYLFPNVVNFRL